MGDASLAEVLETACSALAKPRHTLAEAATIVPDRAGLYAIYGAANVWRQLGLDDPPDDRPLYVGKAEESLVSRDLRTHFQAGKTGQSTVRRTFAALLRNELGFVGVPRNVAKPEKPAHFALSDVHDRSLDEWMRASLQIAVWEKPAACSDLGAVEIRVFVTWRPPLNLKDNPTRWRPQIMAARRVMAKDVRVWAAERGLKL